MTKPDSEAALADAIKSATGPLSVRGGGTRGLAGDGEPLQTGALSGISLYEPGALTIVAGAGTPLSEIDAALAAENQRLAFEPMDHRKLLGTGGEPTLGGVMAANVSGPRRIQGGAARDYALGVRFVDGAGNIVKNGGRVMKNVTGYDLVKLMCGSCGTLGVLTEVSLKVLPVPETSGTLMLRNLSGQDAVDVMSAALGSPYEVTGAAHCAKILDDAPITALRVEGFEASVSYRLEKLKALFSERKIDMEIAPSDMSDWFWEGVRDAGKFSDAEGDVWRVSCKPSDGPALERASGAEECYSDWGGGLIWFRTRSGDDLRARLGAFDGHATLVRASADTRARLGTFHPEAPGVARLSAGLRARFDPRGILNSGLMSDARTGTTEDA
ncbi:FAD-binding protein [Roseobacter sp. S98]|uniref:FAD-binding protein n=1 Tax=Roseobacter algicola (ex Choi et al. 2025) (nom. illeg.) TaxID=3092138 RepID=UPI0035C76C3D